MGNNIVTPFNDNSQDNQENNLVFAKNGIFFTTSEAIAQGTDNEHRAVLQMIDKYQDKIERFGTFAFEMRKSGGRETRIALLNNSQATFLMTLLKNNDLVVEFKVRLVEEFEKLAEQAKTTPTLAPSDSFMISDSIIKEIMDTEISKLKHDALELKKKTHKTIMAKINNRIDDTIQTISRNMMNVVTGRLKTDVESITPYLRKQKRLQEQLQTQSQTQEKAIPKKQQSFLRDDRRSDHAIDTAVGIIAAQHTFNANQGRAVMPAYYITNRQVIWTFETPKHAAWIHALRSLGRLVIDDTYMFHHINGLCATSIQNLQRFKTLSTFDAFKFTDIDITKTDCNQIIDPAYIAPYGITVNLTQKMEQLLSDYDSIKQWADDAVTCPGGMTTGESVFIPADVFLIACIYTEYSAPKDYNFYGKHHNKALS